jgi:glycosyltransferase involved in cell wall biosynthesis
MQLCDELEKTAIVKRVIGSNLGEFTWPIRSAPTVWLEWASDLAIEATSQPQLLDGKRIILRIHSYEVLNGMAAKVNYHLVDDVIFVSNYLRELFEHKYPNRLTGKRVHVIHNGIDLEKFPFVPGKKGRKIAFVGKMDAKKDPMLMLQAFAFLRRRHEDVELHVAGAPDNDRYYLAMPDFLAKNKLEDSTNFYGHVKDVPAWLADKDYILCTSPFESQGVGLLEAMHRGLKPLIYNFPEAGQIYPRNFLWNNLDELEQLLLNGPEPEECRDFVAKYYSMKRQAASFMKVLNTGEEVVEAPPVRPAE